ncbi:MAG: exopolyphosphatase [Gammaproteobacteria bacterium]|nr:exopolyphosphatase [Gammaproteobacteria bacterium]
MSTEKYVAAVDLGSNSFHMVIAEEGEQGHTRLIDRVKEMVRLGAGLDENNQLSREAQDRALECLQRFRQRLQNIPMHRIRAVGTNTLRAAKNRNAFLREAEDSLGHPISIISGHEEARLVYLGAAFDLATSGKKRLVVDIGGGSTELIVGHGFKPMRMDSLHMGCVSISRRFFPDGHISGHRLLRASTFVLHELETVVALYQQLGWDEVVGTSGTIRAIDQLSISLGLKQDWISPDSLQETRTWLLEAGHWKNLDLITEQRRPVLVGGYVILAAIFDALQINRMEASEGALREGVAYELISRLHNEDSRFQGVSALLAQFRTDPVQSQRIEQLVLFFLGQVAEKWNLSSDLDRKLLVWAAQLHEVGITISYSHYNRHSAYIVENSDIDGFSRHVQRVLSLLVLNHRQKIDVGQMQRLPKGWRKKVIYLTVLLRLAITFYRGRTPIGLSHIQLRPKKRKLKLQLSEKWTREHPLTLFDLETEREYLRSVAIELSFETR